MDQTKFDSVWSGSSFTRKASSNDIPGLPSTPQERDAAFTALLQVGGGLKKVAFALQQPLKNRLDYVAVGRKILLVDELPQGEIPAYDLDIPEFGALRIASRGVPPIHEANIKRIEIPTWPLTVDHQIRWEEITIRRYPAFDRAKERCAIAMAIAEDDEVFKVVDAATNVEPELSEKPAAVAPPVVKSHFADLFARIAGRQLVPGAYLVNAKRYGDILKWATADLDQVSLNIIIETGQFGVLFGTRLIVSTRLPYNKIYCVTTPDKLGRIPERKAVEVKIFDNVRETLYDVVAWEQIGIGIHNPAGVAVQEIS